VTLEGLRNRNLCAVIACAQALEDISDGAEFDATILPLLRGLVRADVASFNVIDLAAGRAERPIVDPPDAYHDAGAEILGAYGHQNPLIRVHRPDAAKISDYLTRSELHRLEFYDLVLAVTEVEHQIAFTLPGLSHQVVGIALSRRRPDFTDTDRTILNAVRPFVASAYTRVTARPRMLPPESLNLTHRQGEVLAGLASGLSSLQIALELRISERTVHKHLEHIYAELGVPSRSAAIARAFGMIDGDRPRPSAGAR
jgi:DNA-binding CsgD family transcriptional regulator